MSVNLLVLRYRTNDKVQGTAVMLFLILLVVLCGGEGARLALGSAGASGAAMEWLGRTLALVSVAAVGAPLRSSAPAGSST